MYNEARTSQVLPCLTCSTWTGLLVPFLEAGKGRVINVASAGMYNVRARYDDLNTDKIPYDGTLVYALAKRVQVSQCQGLGGRSAGD
jgi:hypothetical protein